ncbi:MAG: hypothetical protein ACTHNA_11570 [Sphingopyxis terrae]|uniref:hypothetical protein n=1 Tax=Sphingopyxis terrae TaxID=33052 RepID=UPI003F7CFE6F
MKKKAAQYLTTIFYNHVDAKSFPSGFVRENQIRKKISSMVTEYCKAHLPTFALDISDISEEIWSDWQRFGILSKEQDEFAGNYYYLKKDELEKYREVHLRDNVILERANRFGAGFFKDALRGIVAAESGENTANDGEASLKIAAENEPTAIASDRIVSFSDNQPEIAAIRSEIALVREEIRGNNEAGSELGDAREVIDLELEIADEILSKKSFRLKSLVGWLLPALTYLADKFASGAIGEGAKKLISLLLSLN